MFGTRPEAIETRSEPGYWQGVAVMGAVDERNRRLTLGERSTGIAQVAKLAHRTVTAVNWGC